MCQGACLSLLGESPVEVADVVRENAEEVLQRGPVPLVLLLELRELRRLRRHHLLPFVLARVRSIRHPKHQKNSVGTGSMKNTKFLLAYGTFRPCLKNV